MNDNQQPPNQPQYQPQSQPPPNQPQSQPQSQPPPSQPPPKTKKPSVAAMVLLIILLVVGLIVTIVGAMTLIVITLMPDSIGAYYLMDLIGTRLFNPGFLFLLGVVLIVIAIIGLAVRRRQARRARQNRV